MLFLILYSFTTKEIFHFQEEIIFFSFLNSEIQSSSKNQNMLDHQKVVKTKKNTNQYLMEISKGKTTSQKIKLTQTVDAKTLVNEKIAPGTKGSFEIQLTTDHTMNYQIGIEDKTIKPKNLQFWIEEGQVGKLQKNETKTIRITWEWVYEMNEEENQQDTKDGEMIQNYYFEVYVIGK